MVAGELIAIYLTERRRGGLRPVTEVEAVSGRGLCGDRYFRQPGLGTPDQEVTLIEVEALESLERDWNIALQPGQSRRNLVTRGVSLNPLVGQEFAVGEVRLKGVELCEPCRHLQALTVAGIIKALCQRGGLRAQVIQGGMLHVGDRITTPQSCPASNSREEP